MPATNSAFWVAKFDANVTRDLSKAKALSDIGWQVLVIWECETRCEKFLGGLLQRIVAIDPAARRRC